MIRLMVNAIRTEVAVEKLSVGSSALLNDPAAMLAEASSPEGLAKLGCISHEAVIIHPRLAIAARTLSTRRDG
jgi:hypothetical protein